SSAELRPLQRSTLFPYTTLFRSWRALGSLLAGGYLVFLMIVVVFYFVLGGKDRSLIWQALGQGSLLTFGMVLPAFVLLSWAQARARKSTRLNSSHVSISYAVFCL